MSSALKGAQASAPVENAGAVSWDLGDSFNLRLLIHYVGDIHQPLHATSRYTSAYPDGDRGGNSFKLTSKNGVSNLHSLWDSVLFEYSTDMSQPLSTTDWDYLGTESARLTKLYPESSFTNLFNSYAEWDDESLEIATSFVYEGITENTVPSDEYIQNGLVLIEKQLCKAGFRLANLLQTWWGKTAVEAPSAFLQ
jgi:hypothetical protein